MKTNLKLWLTAYVNHKALMEGNTTTGKSMNISNIKVKDEVIVGITGGVITNLKFKNCTFIGNFKNVIFRDCVFTNCKIGAIFEHCDLTNCIITHNCKIVKSQFNFCNLSYTQVDDKILAELNISNCFNVHSLSIAVTKRLKKISAEADRLENLKVSLKGGEPNVKTNSKTRRGLVAKKEQSIPTNTEGSE